LSMKFASSRVLDSTGARARYSRCRGVIREVANGVGVAHGCVREHGHMGIPEVAAVGASTRVAGSVQHAGGSLSSSPGSTRGRECARGMAIVHSRARQIIRELAGGTRVGRSIVRGCAVVLACGAR
ncbi:Unknown protein, partial [Striga hermonthica]